MTSDPGGSFHKSFAVSAWLETKQGTGTAWDWQSPVWQQHLSWVCERKQRQNVDVESFHILAKLEKVQSSDSGSFSLLYNWLVTAWSGSESCFSKMHKLFDTASSLKGLL